MIKSNLKYIGIGILLFITDLFSKYLIVNNMTLNEKNSIQIISDFFYFSYVHNYGAAFSFLGNLGGAQIWLFSIVAITIVGYLSREILYKNDNVFTKIGYSFIIGGAIGNLYDRVVHGYVIDFLDFYIFSFDFAVFNIADVYIFTGFGLTILNELLKNKKNK